MLRLSMAPSAIFCLILCQFVLLLDTANADIEFISIRELVEKIIIDSIPTAPIAPIVPTEEEAGSESSSMQQDVTVPPRTEEASGASSPTPLDVTVALQPEEASGPSTTPTQGPTGGQIRSEEMAESSSMGLDLAATRPSQESQSSGLCAAEESLKVAFCQKFIEYEIAYDVHFERGTGNFVCQLERMVLTELHQSNLNDKETTNMYECPRIAESVLLAEIGTYYVSQKELGSPVIVYTRRNSFSAIHPYKAALHVDSAALAGTVVRYYDQGNDLLEKMDSMTWSEDEDALVAQAQRIIELKKLTFPYEKFATFFRSLSVCGMKTNEKLFACKHYAFARKESVTNMQIDADVNVYEGTSTYRGSECRRHETRVHRAGKSVGLPFGQGLALFQCPPMARYELQQGSSAHAAQPKIYFDHTVRLLSSHFSPAAAFLLDSRSFHVALAATVSGVKDDNPLKLRTLLRSARWRYSGQQREGHYQPARLPGQYTPVQFIEMSRDRAERVIYALKGHANKLPHDKFIALYPRVTLTNYKTVPAKVELCNAVFRHQAFGYEIEHAEWDTAVPFEWYVNRLEFRLISKHKHISGFWCEPSQPTIYGKLFVAGGSETGGVIVLVRDVNAKVLTPLAVAYPQITPPPK